MTNRNIEKLKGFRRHLLSQIEGLTIAQHNEVPDSFNNNIVWNLGHLIAVQQNLCYTRANLLPPMGARISNIYLPGTRPKGAVNDEELWIIGQVFVSSLDRLESDFNQGIFLNYNSSAMIPKVYGFEVNTIDAAIEYLLYHDGYHAGLIKSLKSYVEKQVRLR